ncbi:MAG: restriction endonuclease subunit S [Planctomycetaceae bacterium]|nr:restriction endonuclease subunit S [Planctomycetaceae bacterium]
MSSNGLLEVPLSEVAVPVQRSVSVDPGKSYRTLGVKWWGQGAYERQTIDGSQTAATTLNEVHENDLIINKIWVRHGSVGVVTPDVAGCCGSNEFPTFEFRSDRIIPRWMHWYSKTRQLWVKCDALSRGTSGKNRIRPEKFLTITIPLPPLEEQQRIVARIDHLAAKIGEVQGLAEQCDNVSDSLLTAQFHRITDNVPRRPLGEIAPLIRRPAEIDPTAEYPQVSVRSFGKGTFHNPPLHGSEITWQKPHLVETGDILVSNIKAWEGAIAVAGADDAGRYGSHRYLTFVPVTGVATAHFVCFYLLGPEGLYHVGEASPGSADRNRTLSSKKMLNIEVPVPPFELQQQFDELLSRVSAARNARAQAANARDALLPSILDRAFRGEL